MASVAQVPKVPMSYLALYSLTLSYILLCCILLYFIVLFCLTTYWVDGGGCPNFISSCLLVGWGRNNVFICAFLWHGNYHIDHATLRSHM